MKVYHSLAIFLFSLLSTVTALPIPRAQINGFHLDISDKIPHSTQHNTYTHDAASETSTIFKKLKLPQCKGPSSPSLYWTQSLYGYFITRRPNHRSITASQAAAKESARFPTAYAMAHSLQNKERVFAPAAILFIMLWLAVLIIALIEFASVSWERQAYPTRKGKRYTFSSPEFLEVVIEAVPSEGTDGECGEYYKDEDIHSQKTE